MKVEILHVEFEVNPLGHLDVKWSIPKEILNVKSNFEIEIPGFKYDLPTFASIPVPFSSKGIELTIDEIFVSVPSLIYEIKKGSYSNKILTFKNTGKLVNQDVNISYTIKKIVNHDGIYFVMVYPFRSPFLNCPHKIVLKAKFSYNIRRYKFWERHFSYPQNEKILSSDMFVSQKVGDEIVVSGDYTPTIGETLDLHLTATRFPILLRRDIFWFAVFLIFLLIAISPFITALLD